MVRFPHLRLNVVLGYLKTTSQATYFRNMADMSDPTTAAYMKAHPGDDL